MPSLKKLHQLTGHEAAVFALSPGFDPDTVLSAGGDGFVVEWNLDNPEIGRLIAKVGAQLFSMAALPGERKLVLGNMEGGVHWVSLDDPETSRNVAHHKKGTFAILPAGNEVFTAGGEGRITRWSAEECRSLESLHLTNQSLRTIDFCPQRNELAVGASDNRIYLLDRESLEIRHRIDYAHQNSVFALRYAPGGQYLLSGGRDAHLNAWSLEATPQKIFSQPAHWFTINHIAFHPDGLSFATGSRDKTIKIWDAQNFQLLKVLETVRDQGHLRSVNTLLWSSRGDALISAGDDRSLIVWGE